MYPNTLIAELVTGEGVYRHRGEDPGFLHLADDHPAGVPLLLDHNPERQVGHLVDLQRLGDGTILAIAVASPEVVDLIRDGWDRLSPGVTGPATVTRNARTFAHIVN